MTVFLQERMVTYMYKDLTKSFRNALKSIDYSTLASDITDKIEDAKNKYTPKDISAKRLKSINKSFKSEKFDDLTKMRYRRFRKTYQEERNSIMATYNKNMKETSNKFDTIIAKIYSIQDEAERKKLIVKTLTENIKSKNKIRERFKKQMEEFTEDYKYRALSSDLKWQYIIYDDMDI
jgi:hypothetical protein